MAKIVGQRFARNLRQGSSQLNTRGTAAYDHKTQRPMTAGHRGFAFRQFVGQQNAAANLQRIFDGLQSGSQRLPLVVPEIGMGGACGDDQIVVGKLEAMQLDDAPFDVKAEHLAEQHFDVFMLGENFADRRGDFRRRQSRGRYLVEQRLKGVVVLAVHQRDLDGQSGPATWRPQTTEAASDDDDLAQVNVYS